MFTTSIGTPVEGRNLAKRFQELLKGAKMPNHRLHDLRHAAATLLAVMGVHAKAIHAVVGWDQGAMVDRCAHFEDEMRKDATGKMEVLWELLVAAASMARCATGYRGGCHVEGRQ